MPNRKQSCNRRRHSCSVSSVVLYLSIFTLWLPDSVHSQISPEIINEANRAAVAFQERRYDEALVLFQKAVRLARNHQPSPEEYLLEAQMQLRNGKVELALEAVSQALNLNSRLASAYYFRGHILRLQRKTSEAFESLDEALGRDPDHSGAADELWKLLEPLHNYNLAVKTYQKHLKNSPDSFHLLFHMGLAYEKSGDYERAADALIKAVQLDPRQHLVHNYLVHVLTEGQRDAISEYERLAEEYPDPIMTLFLARLYIQNDRREAAHLLLKDLAQADAPTLDASLRLALAQTFAEMEMFNEAAEQVRRALSLVPPDASERIQLLFNLGKWLVDAGKVEAGISQLRKSLDLHTRTLRDPPIAVFFHLGRAHHLLNQSENAEFYFRKFIQRLEEVGADRDTESLLYLGDIYMEDENFRRAAENYQRVVDVSPRLLQARFKLAQAHFAQQSFSKAIVEAEQVIGDPKLGIQARLLLARAYLRDQQPGKAVAVVEQLEANDQWSDEASAVMGEALLADEEILPEIALDYIEKAYHSDSEDQDRTLLYAKVLMMVERYGESRKLYQEVLAANPRSVGALTGVATLEMRAAEPLEGRRRVSQLQSAVEHLKKARRMAPTDLNALDKLSDAERGLARAEADWQGHLSKWRVAAWTTVVASIVFAVVGLFWRVWLSLQAERTARRVGWLEGGLKQLIREEGKNCWHEEWEDKLTEGDYANRIGGKSLNKKAKDVGAVDFLGVANFGHLVAIIDIGFHDKKDPLGLSKRCNPDNLETKRFIIAALSYIASCRAALVHYDHTERSQQDPFEYKQRDLFWHSLRGRRGRLNHMDSQVRQSLKSVREHFDLTSKAGTSSPPNKGSTATGI